MGAGGAGLSHGTQQCVGASSMACTSIFWSLCNIQTHLCLISQGKGLQEPSSLHCRDAHTPCTHTHTRVVLLSTTLDIPGCLLEGSHPFASRYLVSQQTNWSLKPWTLHRGRKALSISPWHQGWFFRDRYFLAFESRLWRCEVNTYPGAPPGIFFPEKRRREQQQSQLGSATHPRLAPGQRSAETQQGGVTSRPLLCPHGQGASHPPSPAAFPAEG